MISLSVGPAVPSLTRWGLSSDADLTYRTLNCFGPRTQRALAAELGLPRCRIDAALEELRCHGAAAVAANVGGGGRQGSDWVARPPVEVVAALRARRLRLPDELAQAKRHDAVVQLLSRRLAGLGLPAAPAMGGTIGDNVRYLPSRALARRRLNELVSQERHDHLAINTEPVIDVESVRLSSATAGKFFNERGVHVRVLSAPPPDADLVDPTAHLINGTSFQYRETFETPLKLFVCDRKVALFPLDPLDFERGYFEVDRPAVVASLIGLFDRHWDTAVDPQLHGVPSIVLSQQERDLVGLLALGHTDATAARELRISARSVTNWMRAMMDRVGVENRFQLGLALGATRAVVPPALDPAHTSTTPSALLRRAS